MIFSDMYRITFKGKPARLWVMRNNAYCWGRIVVKGQKRELDVVPRRDCYNDDDDSAAATMERVAKRGRVETALSWPMGWVD